MRTDPARHGWRRRVIALAAAYAVALASLIASFGAAQTAAAAAADPGTILCHHLDETAPQAPAGGSNSQTCIGSCCVGYLTPLAALPPRAADVPLVQGVGERLAPVHRFVLVRNAEFRHHRSRAPPLTA